LKDLKIYVGYIDAHRGEGVETAHPKANFQKRVNKNGIKAKFFPKSLDPPGKNLSYPLPWIFNPCASMIDVQNWVKQN